LSGSEVDGENENANDQTCCCHNGQSSASFWRCRGCKGGVVHRFERRLIEVALFVRVRIEEEALGAAFHRGQNLKGFLRMRPVFLRIEPTFESSFFGSVFVVGVGGKVFTAGFLTLAGAAATDLTSVALGSSAAG